LTELDADGLSTEFWAQYQEDPNRSLAMIRYRPGEGRAADFLYATVLIGSGIAPLVYDICKALLSNKGLKYRLLFDFFGFRPTEVDDPARPSVAEFAHADLLRSRPYITSGINIIVPDGDLPR
jgi:hypothetical protein